MNYSEAAAIPGPRVLTRAAALGVVAGMRSLAAPAALSRHLVHDPTVPHGVIDDLLSRPAAPRVLGIASAAEHLADKLPLIPARTDPGPLAARIAAGALCGAVIARRAGDSAVTGAVVGGLAAAAATFAAYHLRHALTTDAGVPDIAIALAEDVAAVALGEAALRG
ncbi:DUF4126 family protein [Longimicrobium sp.]|uniref:DUF4126 family protein n=1 Tax=Longimicrobium sp. TaxID=2029185 RepID=UPI002B775834|nr:DUF4126 family protein [Longimicrobium sp.]HSU15020.1 DUF4126 family protein [Longimicrobium sp.]